MHKSKTWKILQRNKKKNASRNMIIKRLSTSDNKSLKGILMEKKYVAKEENYDRRFSLGNIASKKTMKQYFLSTEMKKILSFYNPIPRNDILYKWKQY